MFLVHNFGVVLVALAIDAVFGDPAPFWHRIGHPVVWIGRLIDALDTSLNQPPARRADGVIAVVVLIVVTGGLSLIVARGFAEFEWGWVVEATIASVFIAQKDLLIHVRAVALPLIGGDLAGARAALGRIVGRDTAYLDEAGIVRAAIESLAESTSDGIVAPAFWGLAFGLPGIVIYKAVNTADSMIGHRTARYEVFGWAAARLDDWLNWIPARLTGLLFVGVAGARWRDAYRILRRDARKHASPNAGFPEAAMAGALDLRLGGPRSYDGAAEDLPWFGDGRSDATAADLQRAEKLFIGGCVLHAGVIALLWLLWR